MTKKYDADKPRPDLLFTGLPLALERIADVLTYGFKKYGEEHGWKKVEKGVVRYEAAKLRHMTERYKGKLLDDESGLEHLAHEVTNGLFLLEMYLAEVKNYDTK